MVNWSEKFCFRVRSLIHLIGNILGISFSEDLTSLRSIAAILGGVSFGIFIFLLICSVVYKRYMSNGDRRDTCPPAGPENDYLDAVQAAAPPSYQTGTSSNTSTLFCKFPML